MKNDIGRVNEVFVDSRRASSGAEALAEFREVTSARLEQLRGFGPDDFGAESWTPVGPGTVRDLLPFRVFDSWVHEQDMRRAVARPGDLDGAVAENAFERITGSMPFVVGKRVGPPDGTTIHFGIAGPLARTFTIAVDGGRARTVDELDGRADDDDRDRRRDVRAAHLRARRSGRSARPRRGAPRWRRRRSADGSSSS